MMRDLEPSSTTRAARLRLVLGRHSVLPALVAWVALAWSPAAGAGELYLVDNNTFKVQRAELDGSNLVDLVGPATTKAPQGIGVDPVHGKVYWTDFHPTANSPRVMRANLDGSDPEPVVASPNPYIGFPMGVAVDPGAGKVYWADTSESKIQRANLDGSNVEVVADLEGVGYAQRFALDLVNGKIYWGLFSTSSKVQRANLDGSLLEDVLTTGAISEPTGIALDILGGKVYWADVSRQELHRANLDGTNAELLLSSLDLPLTDLQGISLDPANEKLYWTDASEQKIQRANLDGSNAEDVLTGADGLAYPRDVDVQPGPVATFSIGQATSSALAGGFPSSPPISIDLHPPDPVQPAQLGVDAVIALATANCGAPTEVDASMTASLPGSDPQRVLLAVDAAIPAGACIDTLGLFFDLIPPDPIAPAPEVGVALVDLAPDGSRFDVFVTVGHESGAEQLLRLGGRVGPGQPAGAVTITDVTALPGSLDLDVDFTTTGSFDPDQPALEVDLAGVVAATAPVAVPALAPPLLALVALLRLGAAGLVLGRGRRGARGWGVGSS